MPAGYRRLRSTPVPSGRHDAHTPQTPTPVAVKAVATPLPEVVLFEPTVLEDERGYFFEAWNRRTWQTLTGFDVEFAQDNVSRSHRHVLRGIHYQVVDLQGKLVRVSRGAVWDVAVDLRRGSPNFLQWVGYELSEHNRRMLWVPPGFGHGFLALSQPSEVSYKVSTFYAPEYDRTVRYDDPQLGISWPLGDEPPLLSTKDRQAPGVDDAELPEWASA